jgi:type I restriction enzyme S subunit
MMTNGWQVARIGEVTKPIERAEEPQAGTTYRQVGVRLWGQGAYERESIDGSQTKYKTLSRVESGDIIVNKIWARNGSIAVVTDELAGCFGSGEFPTFAPDRNKLEPKWFHWMTKTRWFWDACDVKSQGTSGKNRIRPEKFLDIEIPLPPLTEQRRIVAHIESLSARVNEAQRLHEEVEHESETLLRSILIDKSDGEPVPTPMRELVSLREPDVAVSPDEFYHFAGTYSFGRGLFRGIKKKGNQFAYKKLTRLRTNDFTYPKLMAWEGAYAVVPPECDGLVVSTEFPVFELNQEKILPETMAVYFRNPAIWETLSGQSTGTNVRRRRLNPQTFLNHKFPLPPMKRQLLLRDVQAKVNALRELQFTSGEELSALMPSVLDKAFKGEL